MNNDLISRSEAEKLGATCLARRNENGQLEAIISLDNAPTVEDRTEEVLSLQNTIAKLVEGIAENARPQGEWIWLGDNPNPNHKWSCNKCGRGVKEQENFCPNCGAKMKGGAE